MGVNHAECRTWERLGSEVLYRGAHVTLHRDRVVQPDGAEGTYERLTIADGARVVAVDDVGWVALVEDAFAPVGRRLLHVPGGGVAAGEDPEAAAARECEEETGWRPGALRPLGVFHPLPSRTSAVTHLYLGTALRPGTVRRDPTEAGMRVCWMPLDEAVRVAGTGAVTEAGTVVALLMAARLLSAGAG
ncbi:NUDIX domain-containing protein [Streptomyces huiliensis]|uniref:NUDIX domain-containing protein n=1 Tax=Streptomyces huiliensis TaxID=2876027 RepID=UPI001CBE8AF0|nr:NUDIX hydrolase [Streptomyces huiliensis]MBZ4318393.1 NUDIX hydrolase [Streptomyces huiliensis]